MVPWGLVGSVSHGRWVVLALALAAAGSLIALPSAAAQLGGHLTYDLESLEEMRIEGPVNATGELAFELRNRTDRDDDGEVGALEAAGAAMAIEDELEGPAEGTRLDGETYTFEDVDVGIEGLEGPVDDRSPVEIDVEVEARVEPASGSSHVLELAEPFESLASEARIGVDLRAPEGYAIVDAEGLQAVSECHARSPPGPVRANVTLEARSEACPDAVPGLGAAGAALAVLAAGLATALNRRRGPGR